MQSLTRSLPFCLCVFLLQQVGWRWSWQRQHLHGLLQWRWIQWIPGRRGPWRPCPGSRDGQRSARLLLRGLHQILHRHHNLIHQKLQEVKAGTEPSGTHDTGGGKNTEREVWLPFVGQIGCKISAVMNELE